MAKVLISEALVKDQNLNSAQQSENTGIKTFGLDLLTELLGFDAKDYPEQSLFALLFDKKKMSKKDVLDATGLSRRQYEKVFHDRNDRWRGLNTGFEANRAMSNLLEREDLAPHQVAMSELLWKLMKGFAMQEILEQLWIMTGRFIEEDYPQDKDFDMSNFNITPEELNEAIVLHFLHFCESKGQEAETC